MKFAFASTGFAVAYYDRFTKDCDVKMANRREKNLKRSRKSLYAGFIP